ncbi:MAG: glycosyltransferase family 39 protein [Chloroflexaceae bacterium]|nr:glycosyltransferase family 39 protein [Chloroflexaceae bacterium]
MIFAAFIRATPASWNSSASVPVVVAGRHAGLTLILVAFLVLHALYNWAVPLGEGPDEPGHVAYALFLMTERRLPVQRAAPQAPDVPGEGHQPPLAYLLAVPALAWLPADQRQIRLTANPRFLWAGGDEPGAFMRGSWERWPWTGLSLGWRLARALSGAWGTLAVLCTYLAARRLAPAEPLLALTAASLVAFNPQFLFISALVSNDALLAALGAALLWWCLAPPSSAVAWRWAVGAGALFGLALLTKQSALLFGPLLLWGAWRVAGGRPGHFAALTLLWGGVALLIAGWWFGRNALLYGDLFGLAAFRAEFAGQPFAWRDPLAWSGALRQLAASFWARFGWMSLRPPDWTLWLYAALCGLAVTGWLLRLARGAANPAWFGPLLALAMAGAWTLAFALAAGLVAWQGRMLFPALAAIGPLLAAGLVAPPPPAGPGAAQPPSGMFGDAGRAPLRAAMAGLLALLLFLLAAAMPLAVIRPAYPWTALAPREALAELGTPVEARFAAAWERGVVLRGWRLDTPVRPGQPLAVTLTWNSLEPIPRNWLVFVHLVDSAGTIVAKSDSAPRGGTLPFPLWTPGDWVRDTHTLPLPAELPPGRYRLRVGLFSSEHHGQRQPVWFADGREGGDYAEVGMVEVTNSISDFGFWIVVYGVRKGSEADFGLWIVDFCSRLLAGGAGPRRSCGASRW